ncbi:MAG: MoaD/ThiS family protein [Thermacetogeniaceae bacterium]
MKVKFFALLRELTNAKETTAYTAGTVRQLLDALCGAYGGEFTRWIYAEGSAEGQRQLSGKVIVLVNGRAIEHLAGLETALTGTDELALFPRMAGG